MAIMYKTSKIANPRCDNSKKTDITDNTNMGTPDSIIQLA